MSFDHFDQYVRRIDEQTQRTLDALDRLADSFRATSGRTREGLITKTLRADCAMVHGFPSVYLVKTQFDTKQRITFEAHASTWEEDADRDTIQPGAFLESIGKLRGECPLLQGHNRNIILGLASELREDEKGLRFKGVLAGTQAGEEMAELLRIGAVGSFSIGFTLDPKDVKRAGRGRLISKVSLAEVSITPFPANAGAQLIH